MPLFFMAAGFTYKEKNETKEQDSKTTTTELPIHDLLKIRSQILAIRSSDKYNMLDILTEQHKGGCMSWSTLSRNIKQTTAILF